MLRSVLRRKLRRIWKGLSLTLSGYHPWFSHLLSLADPSALPSRGDHYASVFLPPSHSNRYAQAKTELEAMLPDLPDPTSLAPLLDGIRYNVRQAKARGQLVMLGEVGLDKSFRVPYPRRRHRSQSLKAAPTMSDAEVDVAARVQEDAGNNTTNPPDKVLSPFRPSVKHQLQLLELQMDIAVEEGVNVSLHSVQCQGGLFLVASVVVR